MRGTSLSPLPTRDRPLVDKETGPLFLLFSLSPCLRIFGRLTPPFGRYRESSLAPFASCAWIWHLNKEALKATNDARADLPNTGIERGSLAARSLYPLGLETRRERQATDRAGRSPAHATIAILSAQLPRPRDGSHEPVGPSLWLPDRPGCSP